MIQVSDEWWDDPRRAAWVKAIGDEARADGLALRYWRLGKKRKDNLIPAKQFKLIDGWEEFARCELAEERTGGFYIKGSKPKRVARTKKKPAPDGVREVIARYCDLWKQRYKANPPIGGRESGQFSILVRDHGQENSLKFIEAYLQMPDQWFITKRHDVWAMMRNLNAIAQFISTGKMITRKEIKMVEDKVQTSNLLQMVDEGKI